MSDFALSFITRNNCQLCDEARPVVIKIARRHRLHVEEIDVDSSKDLISIYGDRVPVVIDPDGELLAEGRIDRKSLRRAVRKLFQ